MIRNWTYCTWSGGLWDLDFSSGAFWGDFENPWWFAGNNMAPFKRKAIFSSTFKITK